jgi:hypothetical protein
MDFLKKIIGLLPSAGILLSTALCVVIPMVFYWVSDRVRKHDPPWKQTPPGEDLEKTTMRPAGSSNTQVKDKT